MKQFVERERERDGGAVLKERPARDSNAELLRILCMLMIVCHHYIVHSLFPEVLQHTYHSTSGAILLFLHCFIYIGVNCFILISGYYGIKTRIHSFTNIYLICALYFCIKPIGGFFYALTPYGADSLTASLTMGERICRVLSNTFLPISSNGLWFLQCYVALLIMSPILNMARDHFSMRQYQVVLLLMTFGNLYFGWWRNMTGFSADGYATAQFVYLYMVGGYLKKYADFSCMRWKAFAVYVISSLLWGVCVMVIPEWSAFAYNNIFVLLSAMGFFIFVMSFHFQSKVVNWLAASCLAVYIIQERYVNYKLLASMVDGLANWQLVLLLIPLTLLTFLGVILIDKVRMRVQRPLNDGLDKLLARCWSWWR